MSVSSSSSPRATPFAILSPNAGEKDHRADNAFIESGNASDLSTSETPSIEDSDSAKVPPAFQLLFVTGPGTSRKFVDAQEAKCRVAGLPVTMVGDGKDSIVDDLLNLSIDDSLPVMAIYFAHGNVATGHMTWLDDDLPPVTTASVLKLLHSAGVARVTVFACYAGAAAEDVGHQHLTDVASLPASYLFVGRDDNSSSKYISRDDVDGLVDYYCSCAQDGTPPEGLKEHLVMAQISPQTLRYVQASADLGANPVIVHVPGVDSGLADGKMRIRNASVRADSRKERKEVRSGLEQEFRDFKRANQGSTVISGGEAMMAQRALSQQIFDGSRAEVLALMTRGVKPEWNGRDKLTGLQAATFARDPAMLENVLAHADLSQIDETAGVSMSPLVISVGRQIQPHVDLLLAHGAHPNLQSSRGTPLTISLVRQNPGIAKSLLKHHADANLPDKFGLLPLEIAVTDNSKSMALRLLKAGAKPDATASHGGGAMMVKMGSGNQSATKKMANYAFWKGEFKIASMLRKLKKRTAVAGGSGVLPA